MRKAGSIACVVLWGIATVAGAPSQAATGEISVDARSTAWEIPSPEGIAPESRCENIPLLMAEGSNSCEIVSCGMGIKDTCKITCPADKTPKCSCDCLKSFGPMCTEYKANCRCE